MLRISVKYSMRITIFTEIQNMDTIKCNYITITIFTELQNMDSKINLLHGKLKSVKTAPDKIKLLPAK